MTYLANLKTDAGIPTSAAFLSRYRGNLQEDPLTLKSEVESPLPGKVEKEREEKTIASEEVMAFLQIRPNKTGRRVK